MNAPANTGVHTLAPGYRPGERMLAGEPYVFNHDLLLAHFSAQRIARGVPTDLSSLSYDALLDLVATYLNASRDHSCDDDVIAFGAAVCAERGRRPEHQAAYGRVA